MSKSVREACTYIATIVLFAGSTVFAESPDPGPPVLGVVQALVRAAFPELTGKRLRTMVIVHGDLDNDWVRQGSPIGVLVRTADESVAGVDNPSREQDEARLLGGFFSMIRVDGNPQISVARFSGRHVHSAERRTTKDALEAERPKTDADVAARLAARGARYGPEERDAFVRDLRVERFGSALGRVVSHDVQFFWRQVFEWDNGAKTREDIVEPEWLVSTRNETSGADHVCHIMAFEPFEGRLTSVERVDCWDRE